jgi:glutamate synthase (NADPH/NADH) large chain
VDDHGDIKELQTYIHNHLVNTNSWLAEEILVNWEEYLPKFVKVIPFEYKKVLEEQKIEKLREKLALTEDDPQHQY